MSLAVSLYYSSTIQFDDLMVTSDKLFKDLGTDTTRASDPDIVLSEDDILKKLKRSRNHAAEGKYRDANDMIFDMRGKHGI